MSKVDKSKCSGGWHEMRSDASVPKYRVAHSKKCITLEWVMTTPLGTPVEPDVNRMWAASSNVVWHAGARAGTEARSSQEKAILRLASAGSPGSSHPTWAELPVWRSDSKALSRLPVAASARMHLGSHT